jgi:hypothetical protein
VKINNQSIISMDIIVSNLFSSIRKIWFKNGNYHSILNETGTVTLVELSVKHGVLNADVVRKRWPPKKIA